MGTDKGDGPPKDKPDPAKADDKAGALDHEVAVAAEPGPAAPVAAEVAEEIAADEAKAAKATKASSGGGAPPGGGFPPTGKKAGGASDEPPLRESMASFGDDVPMTFPDDGQVAKTLRKVDHYTGLAEQAVLFALLAVVVIAGAAAGIADKVLGKSLPSVGFIMPTGVLAIAMIGAAFASHQQRHLAMDLISRRLPPRGRLILRVFLAIITIVVVAFLARSFWGLFKQASGEHNANNPLPAWAAPITLPLGAGLVIFHTFLHLVIDAEYLVRGKLPPERARSAH